MDSNGVSDFARSYVASCGPEDLTLAQIEHPSDTIVITEKWGHVDNGVGPTGTKVNNESWLEPFDGDECQAGSDVNSSGGCIDPQPGYPTGMVKMANWHSERNEQRLLRWTCQMGTPRNDLEKRRYERLRPDPRLSLHSARFRGL